MADAYLIVKDNGAEGLAIKRLSQAQFEAASGVAGLKNGLTAHVSDTMTAPANLVAGDYVMAAGTFYRVIQNVANGGTLTVNGNVVAADVGAELNKRANQSGTYDGLTAGNAKQLISTVGVTDKVPYNFRTSGGGAAVGDRETEKIVGGTVAWNQKARNGDFQNSDNWYGTSGAQLVIANGIAAITPAAAYQGITQTLINGSLVPGHKLLMTFYNKSDNQQELSCGVGDNQTFTSTQSLESTTGWQLAGKIYVIPSTAKNSSNVIFVRVPRSTGISTFYLKDVMLFDLTQMFGTAIADYIYSLEQATPGAGVAWFRKLFPRPYYAYDSGSLQSVKAASHKMTGFNQWDEEWEVGKISITTGGNISGTSEIRSKNYIPVIAGNSYYVHIGGAPWMAVELYDSNQEFVANAGGINNGTVYTIPSGVAYIRFYTAQSYGTTYNHDICINLSWDGSRDGEYEPYEAHTYDLDPDLELRGIPKLDADDRLYYDGDVYESDGTVTRKYGIVDLGSLTWSRNGSTTPAQFYGVLSGSVSDLTGGNVICHKYISGNAYASTNDKTICRYGSSGFVWVNDNDYSDAAAFKAAVSGVYLVYELAEPTTETADPYQNPQIVDDFGTEEYVDAGVTASTPTRDVAIPVGHETVYQANLRAKLEMAPNSPDGDGDYIVRQAGGQNTYVPLTLPIDELPAAPTTDGTYTLKCTVSSGTPTFSWGS